MTERELRDMYTRYKRLALSATAALILEEPESGLSAEIDALVADARGAGHATCAEAASRLQQLLAGDGSDSDLDDVRASHRRLRREIWSVFPCEYVPCCAGGATSPER